MRACLTCRTKKNFPYMTFDPHLIRFQTKNHFLGAKDVEEVERNGQHIFQLGKKPTDEPFSIPVNKATPMKLFSLYVKVHSRRLEFCPESSSFLLIYRLFRKLRITPLTAA
jgi:hypothetical protein